MHAIKFTLGPVLLLFLLTFNSFSQEEGSQEFYDNFFKGQEFFDQEDYANALPFYEKAWEEARNFEDGNSIKSSVATLVGTTHNFLQNFDKAVVFLEETIRLLEIEGRTSEEHYDNIVLNLITATYNTGDFAKALTYIENSLRSTEAKLGRGSANYGYRLSDKADTLVKLGRIDEGIQFFELALNNLKSNGLEDSQDYRDIKYNYATVVAGQDLARGLDVLYELFEAVRALGMRSDGNYYTYAMDIMNVHLALGNNARGHAFMTDLMEESKSNDDLEIYYMLQGHRASFTRFLADYNKAIAELETAISELEALGVTEEYIIAQLFGELGINYLRIGQYDKAEDMTQRSLSLLEKLDRVSDSRYSGALGNLAYIYQVQGQFDKAMNYYKDCLENHEKYKLGRDRQYATYLMNYGALFREMALYDESERLLLESLNIMEELMGTDHKSYGDHALNLGELYYWKQDFKKSIYYNTIAADLYRTKTTVKDPSYSYALTNLAVTYQELGDFDGALNLLLESLDHIDKTLGNKHFEYGKIAQNVAKIYYLIDDYEQAVKYYELALENYKVTIGVDHYLYGNMCANLALLLIDLDILDLAEQLIDLALSIFERTHGKDSFYYATALNGAADIKAKRGDFAAAVAYNEQIIDLLKKSHGDESDILLGNYLNLAINSQKMGDSETAQKYFEIYNTGILELFENIFTYRSENDKKKAIANMNFWRGRLRSLLNEPGFDTQKLLSLNLNNNLIFKGLLLNSSKDILAKLKSLNNAQLDQKINRLRQMKSTWSAQVNIPLDQRTSDLEALKNDINDLETQLVQDYNEQFDDNYAFRKDWRDIRNTLKSGEIAVEFANYNPLEQDTLYVDINKYDAYLIHPEWEQPRLIPLFEEGELKEALRSKTPDQLYSSRGSVANQVIDSKRAFDLIWSPLQPYLEGVETIYFSPSGILNQIAFSALSNQDGTTLSTQYNLVQLSSVSKINELAGAMRRDNALFIGGIDYEYKGQMKSADTEMVDMGPEINPLKNAQANRGQGESWNYLPGTLKEVNTLTRLYRQNDLAFKEWSAQKADERAFKALSGNSPRILHIATHGFFYENLQEKQVAVNESSENTYKYADDPLLRSGLVLAGGNYAWKNGGNPYEQEDGILTALEISNLDLSKTDMVVLSACETGLGDIDGSEGVYGLQRAFKMAGVDIIVMSLWQVPDKETAEFMSLFYENWLGGQEVRSAFSNTQKTMQERYKDEPLKWAAFVLFE